MSLYVNIPGLASGALATVPAGSSLGTGYTADHVDFLSAVGGTAMIPNFVGKIFNWERSVIGFRSFTGTATGNLVFSVGNSAGEANIMGPATVTAAAINTATGTGFLPFQAAFLTVGVVDGPLAQGAATLRVRTAPTGLTVLTGWVTVWGNWIDAT